MGYYHYNEHWLPITNTGIPDTYATVPAIRGRF
jgi:hypothetical protein